jgi:uncharacterized protein YndB with AHSA1/START domain
LHVGGSAEEERVSNVIEKCIELDAPPSLVWRALTDYREFGEWFRVNLDGPFVPGQVTRGTIAYPGYEHLKWEATVQKMEAGRLFSFTWRSIPMSITEANRRRWSSSGLKRKAAALS